MNCQALNSVYQQFWTWTKQFWTLGCPIQKKELREENLVCAQQTDMDVIFVQITPRRSATFSSRWALWNVKWEWEMWIWNVNVWGTLVHVWVTLVNVSMFEALYASIVGSMCMCVLSRICWMCLFRPFFLFELPSITGVLIHFHSGECWHSLGDQN